MRLRQSDNGIQWFVVKIVDGGEEIVKIFYTREDAMMYMAKNKKLS